MEALILVLETSEIDTRARSQGAVRSLTGRQRNTKTRPGPKSYPFRYARGDRIGDELIVLGQISAGPFTEIYRVWCESLTGAFVCKAARKGIDPAHAKALEREGKLLSRISHPNVIRAYSCGNVEGSHILMEYVAGPSLYELLSRSPRRRLKPNTALRIAIGIGAAVSAVHGVGFLYRDLKPSNVLLRDGQPVLVDLGAAYKWAPGRKPRTRIGTDPYMAPEQCLGRALSPATDVFGLGAVTYEMLTGEWPFEDILMNVFDRTRLRNRFPQIANRPGSLKRKVPDLDPQVAAVVEKCLERRPEDRFGSIEETIAALNGTLAESERVFPVRAKRKERNTQAA